MNGEILVRDLFQSLWPVFGYVHEAEPGLKRWLNRASFPLAWLSNRHD